MKVKRSLHISYKKAGLISVVAIAGVLGLRYFTQAPPTSQFSEATTGLKFDYSQQLRQTYTGGEEDEILARIEQGPELDANILITVRTESGFAKITGLTRQSPLDTIKDAIARAYPSRFPGYSQISQRAFEVESLPAIEVVFEYNGPSEEPVSQKLVAIIINSDQAVYVSAQTLSRDFTEVDRQYFNIIFSSIHF